MSSSTLQALPNTLCPLCGGTNECVPANTGQLTVECWCSKTTISAEALACVPAEQINKACLCPRCAAGLTPPMARPTDPTNNGTAP